MKKQITFFFCVLAITLLFTACGANLTSLSFKLPDSIFISESANAIIQAKYDKENISEEKEQELLKGVTLTWGSSDEKVLTVDQTGKITGISSGKGIISLFGKGKNSEYSFTKEIAVIVPLEGVEAPAEIVLYVGGESSAQLNAKAKPEKASVTGGFAYKSADDSVATVSADGTVTAIKNGETVITTTLDDKSTETKVIVKTAATGIALDKAEGILLVGDTTTLKANLTPAEAYTQELVWKSSDESIATVENGTIIAKKTGTATIAVTTSDGKLKAEYKLTVNEKKANTGANTKPGTSGTTGSNTGGNAGNTTPTTPPPSPPSPPSPQPPTNGGAEESTGIPFDPDAGDDAGDLT